MNLEGRAFAVATDDCDLIGVYPVAVDPIRQQNQRDVASGEDAVHEIPKHS